MRIKGTWQILLSWYFSIGKSHREVILAFICKNIPPPLPLPSWEDLIQLNREEFQTPKAIYLLMKIHYSASVNVESQLMMMIPYSDGFKILPEIRLLVDSVHNSHIMPPVSEVACVWSCWHWKGSGPLDVSHWHLNISCFKKLDAVFKRC